MRNGLPSKICKYESGIVNLDDEKGPGSHWTSYVKRGTDVLYFDSIGHLKLPLELTKYFLSDGSKNNILYNRNTYQILNSYNCCLNLTVKQEIN